MTALHDFSLSALGSATIAILLGCGSVILLLWGLNGMMSRLPSPWNDRLLPWVYLSPALAVLGVYLVFPTLWTLYISFFDARSAHFIGLENYKFAFSDRNLLLALQNNLLWLLLVTGISVSLGLILAVLVDRLRYETWIKSFIFLPMAISFVGASVIWKFVYAFRPAGSSQIGLFNGIVVALGGDPIGWLVERPLNTFALILIMIWLQTGFCLVIFSAAVKAVPSEITEAARLDGANEWQLFWRITFPLIRPTLWVVVTTVVVAVLKIFDIVFVMTGGNLGTEVIASRMIKEMFTYRNFGHGSAIAVILLLAVIPVMVANIRRSDPV
ncbi:MAG: carbohydrate ABC transporter permease [Prochlorotrichaceae cyanobacterium]